MIPVPGDVYALTIRKPGGSVEVKEIRREGTVDSHIEAVERHIRAAKFVGWTVERVVHYSVQVTEIDCTKVFLQDD